MKTQTIKPEIWSKFFLKEIKDHLLFSECNYNIAEYLRKKHENSMHDSGEIRK
jgi:hypothetical protein